MNDVDPEKLLGETRKAIDLLDSAADQQTFVDKLTQRVSFDSEDFYRLVQSIRESLPQELEAAQEIIEKRDTIIENAKREHEEILEAAYQRQEDLVSEETVLQKARVEAEEVLDEAEEEARQLRSEALRYSLQNLEFLEEKLSATLNTIRNGIDHIDSRLEEGTPEGAETEGAEQAGAKQVSSNRVPATEPPSEEDGSEGRASGSNAQRDKGVE